MPLHVGDRGRTVTDLRPHGYVQVNERQYDARAELEMISSDCDVIILGGDHFGLVVRQIEPGQPFPPLPNAGAEIKSSYSERITREADKADAERERRLDARRVYVRQRGALFGSVAGVITIALEWGLITAHFQDTGRFIFAVIAMVLSMVWGVMLSHTMEVILTQLDEGNQSMTLPSTCLGLLGTAITAVQVLPDLGLGLGALLSSVVGFLFAMIIPIFGFFKEGID